MCVFLVIAVVFAGFIITRTVIAKPSDNIKLVQIPANEHDPATWGKYYPLQYNSYNKMQETTPSPTGYGGSVVVQKSEMQPEMLTLFKGMPFSKDYGEDRGHTYAMHDLKETKRINENSKAACITCKTSYLDEIYKEIGWTYASKPLTEVTDKIKHGISCDTCHDPATMNLRVINPAFIEAQARRGIDVSKASRNDMRTYVCAQCHSEYYFEPGTMKIIFPWDKGLTAEEMYVYYADNPNGFVQDWQHPDSKAAMLKAQHPDYEMYSSSSHAHSGVSCADCHMPFVRENGQKYSSHWVTSPLKTTKTSCVTCHDQGVDWAFERVKDIQDKTFHMQHTAGLTIAKAHEAIKKASEAGNVNQEELLKARALVREAQWYWDIIAAENSMGFHNSPQIMSTLNKANELGHKAIEAANRAANIGIL